MALILNPWLLWICGNSLLIVAIGGRYFDLRRKRQSLKD